MICYFWECLKPSIKVEMEQQDRELMDFEEMVQRAVNAEAKAGLRSSAIVRDLDIYCPRGHRPSNSTASKMQTQGTTAKEPRPKKSKSKDTKAIRVDAVKPSEQDKKDQKDRQDKKRRFWEKREPKKTPVTGDNAINTSKKGLRKKCDISKVTYFNCDKKGHYASNYTEPPKN